jgi:hypothetical protein
MQMILPADAIGQIECDAPSVMGACTFVTMASRMSPTGSVIDAHERAPALV